MSRKINKTPLPETSSGTIHKSKQLPDDLVRFSFRHLHMGHAKFGLPAGDRLPHYVPQLLERLKEVSGFKLSEFRTNKSRALRAHTHTWSETSEPDGFSHLNEQIRDCEPWQFCLSANEHGRIHGLLIDEVFYVIWIDPDHRLYP